MHIPIMQMQIRLWCKQKIQKTTNRATAQNRRCHFFAGFIFYPIFDIMKRYILILSVLAISCEKEYTCEIKTPGLENSYFYKFEGSKQEMKDFENSGSAGQTINCK